MEKLPNFFIILTAALFVLSCETVSNKIEEKTTKEEIELSKWLNKSEEELKIVFGKPNKILFKDGSKNRQYIYIKKKMKIKCERKFEIDSSNTVVGFSSKNCF